MTLAAKDARVDGMIGLGITSLDKVALRERPIIHTTAEKVPASTIPINPFPIFSWRIGAVEDPTMSVTITRRNLVNVCLNLC